MFENFSDFAKYFAELTESFGAYGFLFFVFFYIIAVLAFVPITPFSLTAGALFGWWGVPIAYCAAVVGSMVAFLIARGIGHDLVLKLGEKRPLVRAIEQIAVKGGFRLILLIRLSGVLPLAVQNYSFGATGVSLRSYLYATMIGMIPGAIIKVWIGKTGMDVISGAAFSDWVNMVGLLFALAMTVIMLIYVGKLAVKELRAQGVIQGPEDTPVSKTS